MSARRLVQGHVCPINCSYLAEDSPLFEVEDLFIRKPSVRKLRLLGYVDALGRHYRISSILFAPQLFQEQGDDRLSIANLNFLQNNGDVEENYGQDNKAR